MARSRLAPWSGPSLRSLSLFLLAGIAACGSGPNERTEITVFAASSLTDVFTALESAFEETHPDFDVVLSFAGSQVLRFQIEQGAPAHLFASADEGHARALETDGLAGAPEVLAYNRLAVIVPTDNPAGIESLADLPAASRVVIASETVPLGRYTQAMLERARDRSSLGPSESRYGPAFVSGTRASIVSEENNARLVRAKVELGEADAAIVYLTDALASVEVRTIRLPSGLDVLARYVVAPLRDADGTVDAGAERFIRFTQSEQGRALLREYGFSTDGEGA